MHENVLQQRLYVKVENFGIKVRSPKEFEKGDMPIILTRESTTIVSSITTFEPTLIPIFSFMIISKNSNPSHCNPSFPPLTLLLLLSQ
jgi:hypothetical protein